MVKLFDGGAYLVEGRRFVTDEAELTSRTGRAPDREDARRGTMAYSIIKGHNTSGDDTRLRLKFDAMASHDITYVGIVQTARASGLDAFPMPYVLTNCHNSLCAVGGTINEDDHLFGFSAAQRYGGIYVPAHQAVIHQYMREMMSRCGSMILGSDSHTRYGALGTMAVGEGGPELVKQLLGRTYDIDYPKVIAVYLTGTPLPGVGPQDIALALIGAVYKNGYVKNCVMEFVGDGIAGLGVEYRSGIDVMTTETTCLSSIWETDDRVRDYYELHGRLEGYAKIAPAPLAYYDGVVYVDLSTVRPMIAMPFHPSHTYEIEELLKSPGDILHEVETTARRQLGDSAKRFSLQDKLIDGKLHVDQGVIAGCAGGTYDNIVDAADILNGCSVGNGAFTLSVYPASQPIYISLVENGCVEKLMTAGATLRTAFCGPCFGAGDVPANNSLSIRHSTRNFPNREGSRPDGGQIASVALMDARSIAATAANGGILTPATRMDVAYTKPEYRFKGKVYENRVYNGWGHPLPEAALRFGPNIADWPAMGALPGSLLLQVASVINDPVTTTDELIPSGETSSYRSNPHKLAEFTLSRKDPGYVGRAKAVRQAEAARIAGKDSIAAYPELERVFAAVRGIAGYKDVQPEEIGIGSVVYAVRPGDGSAREQAASCQKVLGGWANIAREYATKRYRSNLINWGMLPLEYGREADFEVGDYIYLPCIADAVSGGSHEIHGYIIHGDAVREIDLVLGDLTDDERRTILAGCLINFYRNEKK